MESRQTKKTSNTAIFTQRKFETTVADRAFGGILYVKSQMD